MFSKGKLKIKKLREDAKIPSFNHDTDAGLDMHSVNEVLVAPLERKSIETGIAMELPKGYAGLIWERSGLALKEGIMTMGGVIDEGYRGEIKIIIHNMTNNYYQIRKGDRIAQMLIQKVEHPVIEVTGMLTESEREEKGFGSSGK